jgi:hypothetical protein
MTITPQDLEDDHWLRGYTHEMFQAASHDEVFLSVKTLLAVQSGALQDMREAIRQALERLPYRVQWLSDLELQEVRADLSQSLNPKNEEGKK